jgi:ubiquinone/menaquinone biosynthesis C-methylase UbiE
MTSKFSQAEVYDFWTKQALEHGQASAASWSDHRVIEMEIREITRRLNDGDHVLEAGCANGYSSLQFACACRVELRGVDYVSAMIEQARQRAAGMTDKLMGSVEFEVGDITQLKEHSGGNPAGLAPAQRIPGRVGPGPDPDAALQPVPG